VCQGPLPGTKRELEQIRELWPQTEPITPLSGNEANEFRLRQTLPGARWIHLATHGFFADAAYRSWLQHDTQGERLFGGMHSGREQATVTGRNPLILSGVVLAGANQPAATDKLGLPTGQDGIMTAEEIVSLDLRNAELVVLSACETGLGAVAGGEGVMGLQRAFHLAGARTTIASLWKVDDNATQALMVEFYRNLWEKKLGKLESLRQAQLTMLRGYDPRRNALRGAVTGIPQKSVKPQATETGRLSPYYWAAFSLSGDWR
jgi:CHAT domain-containing protein